MPHHHHAHRHAAAHDHSAHHHGGDPTFLPRLLDLDAEVHADLLEQAVGLTADLAGGAAGDRPVARVLDVGAGTGTGTVVLARHFPAADVVALDADPAMLERVTARTAAAGLTGRVRTVRADIVDGPLPADVDVIWSSAALHEVGDPVTAFRGLLAALRPGGLLVVVEMDGLPRLLPVAFAEFEQRIRAAGAAGTAEHRIDWAPLIRATGFELLQTRPLRIDRTLPADGPAGEWARLELTRVARVAGDALEETDRATLRALTGDGSGRVGALGELWVRGGRTLWAARRP
ncbi:class I SAM-dependent methyltransferase [Nakamurella leprariae]|uniref:Class I SAM-dependent methyltransferase n=1 Tax=Nakamurella leprariae TaxID=2803911 RepID=A0A938YIZ7_9ACTN|nr:class I SAM-dependent methyltransferase [Nakamurella leprariae]MBM9468738.1 class I SAM-dependent methyltransferase [Nakamurella leprariae]